MTHNNNNNSNSGCVTEVWDDRVNIGVLKNHIEIIATDTENASNGNIDLNKCNKPKNTKLRSQSLPDTSYSLYTYSSKPSPLNGANHSKLTPLSMNSNPKKLITSKSFIIPSSIMEMTSGDQKIPHKPLEISSNLQTKKVHGEISEAMSGEQIDKEVFSSNQHLHDSRIKSLGSKIGENHKIPWQTQKDWRGNPIHHDTSTSVKLFVPDQDTAVNIILKSSGNNNKGSNDSFGNKVSSERRLSESTRRAVGGLKLTERKKTTKHYNKESAGLPSQQLRFGRQKSKDSYVENEDTNMKPRKNSVNASGLKHSKRMLGKPKRPHSDKREDSKVEKTLRVTEKEFLTANESVINLQQRMKGIDYEAKTEQMLKRFQKHVNIPSYSNIPAKNYLSYGSNAIDTPIIETIYDRPEDNDKLFDKISVNSAAVPKWMKKIPHKKPALKKVASESALKSTESLNTMSPAKKKSVRSTSAGLVVEKRKNSSKGHQAPFPKESSIIECDFDPNKHVIVSGNDWHYVIENDFSREENLPDISSSPGITVHGLPLITSSPVLFDRQSYLENVSLPTLLDGIAEPVHAIPLKRWESNVQDVADVSSTEPTDAESDGDSVQDELQHLLMQMRSRSNLDALILKRDFSKEEEDQERCEDTQNNDDLDLVDGGVLSSLFYETEVDAHVYLPVINRSNSVSSHESVENLQLPEEVVPSRVKENFVEVFDNINSEHKKIFVARITNAAGHTLTQEDQCQDDMIGHSSLLMKEVSNGQRSSSATPASFYISSDEEEQVLRELEKTLKNVSTDSEGTSGVDESPSSNLSHPKLTSELLQKHNQHVGKLFNGYMKSPNIYNPIERLSMQSGASKSTEWSQVTESTLKSELFTDDCLGWRKGRKLGHGSYGVVYEGLTKDGQLIAVKQVCLTTGDTDLAQKEFEELHHEVDLLKTLSHENVVKLLGTSLDGSMINIFMEHITGGSIASLLLQYGPLQEQTIRNYTKQILKGIEYLHENNVIHRDIKGSNVMVMTSGRIKLIDFGCAKRLRENSSKMNTHSSDDGRLLNSVRGTPYWMAPEVITCDGHGSKSDIWSVGCTVFEMATSKPPLSELIPQAAMYHIGSGNKIPDLPGTFSKPAIEFVKLCLTEIAKHRPSATELLKSRFIMKRRRRKSAKMITKI